MVDDDEWWVILLVRFTQGMREWSISSLVINNHPSNPHCHPFPTLSTSKSCIILLHLLRIDLEDPWCHDCHRFVFASLVDVTDFFLGRKGTVVQCHYPGAVGVGRSLLLFRLPISSPGIFGLACVAVTATFGQSISAKLWECDTQRLRPSWREEARWNHQDFSRMALARFYRII